MSLRRQQLKGNILDQTDDLEHRLRTLEEFAALVDINGFVRSSGLLIRVTETAPPAPPPGHVVMYIQNDGGISYLRLMDENESVRDLTNWSENGMDVRVRHVTTGEYWRLFLDDGPGGVDQFSWEELI